MKKLLLSICLLVPCGVIAQTYKIESIDQPITVKRNKGLYTYIPSDAKGLALLPTDTIVANRGTVKIFLTSQGNNGVINIPLNCSIKVSSLVRSSYFRMDASDRYWELFKNNFQFFMNFDEDKHTFHNRYLNEIGAVNKGLGNDLLISGYEHPENSAELEKEIVLIQKSFSATGHNDSGIFYITRAVLFEKNFYFIDAYTDYHNAYLYIKKNSISSSVIINSYKQFLYKIGKFEEADRIK